ncbi:MAG: TIGR04211 family SH3 domain-containing protein [Desulfobacterota bacterium]|nr:TIGR04211 family SH3 domain-containing protein [Thermodesulfobacteriota bacterium]
MHRIVVGAALAAFIVAVASAETLYVTDKMEILVREGKGMEHKIIGIARSNDPVEVLATEGEYAQVRLANGLEGWVLSRYLTTALPKTKVIENLRGELEQIKERLKQAQDDNARLAEEKKGLEAARTALDKRVQELTAENSEIRKGCADFIALRDQHTTLTAEMAQMQTRLRELTAENESLRDTTRLVWFIVGAGAVVSGFVVGVVLQGLRMRRRKSLSF